MGEIEGLLRLLGGELGKLRAEIDQHQVIVGAAGNDLVAARLHRRGERAGVLHDLRGVGLELRLETFGEADRLAGEDAAFHKHPDWIKPLNKAPYAAFDLSFDKASYAFLTLGGLQTDPNGQTLTFTYDLQGRLRTKTYPGGQQVVWTYDDSAVAYSKGRLTKVEDLATATSFDKETYKPIDALDQISARPDFAIAVYSGYLKAKDKDAISADLRATIFRSRRTSTKRACSRSQLTCPST